QRRHAAARPEAARAIAADEVLAQVVDRDGRKGGHGASSLGRGGTAGGGAGASAGGRTRMGLAAGACEHAGGALGGIDRSSNRHVAACGSFCTERRGTY